MNGTTADGVLRGSLATSQPEGQLMHAPREEGGWPQQEDRRSSLDAPVVPVAHHHRQFSLPPEVEVEDSSSDYEDGDEINCGDLENNGTTELPVWEETIVVSHPPEPAGYMLCVEVKPRGGGQRVERSIDFNFRRGFGDDRMKVRQATKHEGSKVCTSAVKLFFSAIRNSGCKRRGDNRRSLSRVPTEEVAPSGVMDSYEVDYPHEQRSGAQNILVQRKEGRRPTRKSDAYKRRIGAVVQGHVRNDRMTEGKREQPAGNT